MSRTYSIFGVTVASDYDFANRLLEGSGKPDLAFSCVSHAPVPDDWRESAPVMESRYRLETGESVLRLFRGEDYEVMGFTGVADFYLWPDRIVCHLLDPAYPYAVEISLLGLVLAYWMERRGVLMLHASSVVVGERAVAFLSVKQGGKTSIAAAMMQRGYPLLTDDLLPVGGQGPPFIAFPAYPQMRFWPADAQHFMGRFEDLDRVHPNYAKRRAPVGENGIGSFSGAAKTLASVYVPERRSGGQPGVEIAPKPPSDAVIELVRHSFTPNLVEAAGLQPRRLRVIGELARGVPVKRLVYPGGFAHLPEVCAAIVEDVSRNDKTRSTP